MENLKTTEVGTRNHAAAADETVEVLYQKMGNRWFAFSLVDGELFMGSITQEEIDTGTAGNT